jgi:exopolyphosphatase/guanosine-5'-triphosphate,3'-diphosphate pyrophosphatase
MRVAVADVGTNSTRLLIADIEAEQVKSEPARRSTVTRLGAGVDADGRLREDAMERVYRTLREYDQLIRDHQADKKLAVFTSAVRDAENGTDFANSVGERFGLEPHILTGDDEAALTFLGATSERDPSDPTTTLVVDIGGGSTELVIGTRREPSFHVSTQAGVVRQTERHIRTDPPTRQELDELARDVTAILENAVQPDQRTAVEHAIAVAGTATSLGAIAQALEPYDPAKVQGYLLTRPEIEDILERLSRVPLDVRRRTPGLHPDRAPTILAGIVILQQVLDLFGLNEIEVSEHDILRGAALTLCGADRG